MSIYSIVPCNEVHGSIEESFSITDGPECKVTLQCDYNDRYDLVSDLILFQRLWPFYISAFVPRAVSCTITNIPTNYIQDGQAIVYDQSLVAVTYNSKYPDLFSEELELNTEFQTLDPKNFTWNNAKTTPLSANTQPGFIRRNVAISKTWFDVLDPIPQVFLNYTSPAGDGSGGAVNEDEVTNSMGFVFPPETLLFTPPRLSRTVRFDSTNAWQINTKFMHNPTGWNKFWNPQDMQYQNIKTKPNTFGGPSSPAQLYKPYTPMPFMGIFF